MKGISPIIAIIIILLITIAIAGAAYSYISMLWTRVTTGLEFVSSSCKVDPACVPDPDATPPVVCNKDVAVIKLRNIGTTTITAADIEIERTNPSGTPKFEKPTSIEPGKTGEINDTVCEAGNTCIYNIIEPSPSVGPLPVSC